MIVCIRHKEYKGSESPTLSCKACCNIFIAAIKAKQPADFNPTEWLKEKAKESEEYWRKK